MKLGGEILTAGVATALLALALAAPADAASNHPTGEFARFAECPLSEKSVDTCIFSVSRGGTFAIGAKVVPLKNPITFQGGGSGSGANVKFFGAENGETLSETSQPVPGGLQGATAPTSWPVWLQEWFDSGIEEDSTDVTATLELARPATSIQLSTENLIFEKGTALELPVKVKLSNPLLGDNCYIGSSEKPVQIAFTTGQNGKLHGTPGKNNPNKEFTLITLNGGRLVNNEFAVAGASGCGGIFSFFVDPFIDSLLRLPSPAGKNSAILEGRLQAGTANTIRESE